MKPLKAERKILTQGELDGACYLYSLSNAYVCLTGKRPTQNNWDKTIDILPFQKDFLKSSVGTENCYKNNIDMKELTANFFKNLSCRSNLSFDVVAHENIDDKESLGMLINDHTVSVFCMFQEHWVVGSSYDKKKDILRIACSYQLLENAPYIERLDELYNRPYNAITKRKNLGCKGTVFSVTVNS